MEADRSGSCAGETGLPLPRGCNASSAASIPFATSVKTRLHKWLPADSADSHGVQSTAETGLVSLSQEGRPSPTAVPAPQLNGCSPALVLGELSSCCVGCPMRFRAPHTGSEMAVTTDAGGPTAIRLSARPLKTWWTQRFILNHPSGTWGPACFSIDRRVTFHFPSGNFFCRLYPRNFTPAKFALTVALSSFTS